MGACCSSSDKQSKQSKFAISHFKTKKEMIESNRNANFESMAIPQVKSDTIFDCSTEDVQKVYAFCPDVIGKGHYGSVRIAKLKWKGRKYDQNDGKKFAVKTIDLQKIGDDLYLLNRELNIMRH